MKNGKYLAGWSLLALVFLGTAALGVWAAYDRSAAWPKFGGLLVAVVLGIFVAALPRRVLWVSVGWMLLWGVALGTTFLLAHDWRVDPVEFGFANRLGQSWMAVRPDWHLLGPEAEETSFLLTVLVPLALAWLVYLSRGLQGKRRILGLLFSLGGLVILLVSLILTGEWLPWASLLFAGGIGGAVFLWHRVGRTHRMAFTGLILLLGLMSLVILITNRPFLRRLGQQVTGEGSASSRIEVWGNSLHLAQDFVWLGGGLNAFDGLYSQYILAIPFSFTRTSHSLFLDVAVEQGLIGLLALLWIWARAFGQIVSGLKRTFEQESATADSVLWVAIAAGMIAATVLALADKAFYGNLDLVALFWLPGLAAALEERKLSSIDTATTPKPSWKLQGIALAGILLLVIGLGGRAMVARAFSNWGAIQMARIELKDFPASEWKAGLDGQDTASTAPFFEQALNFSAQDRTALHRLGLIALAGRSFDSASEWLEQAAQIDPFHRGIRKTLGYSLAWSGQGQSAALRLAGLPEAGPELEAYSYWWQSQGRQDLAEASRSVIQQLYHRPVTEKKITWRGN